VLEKYFERLLVYPAGKSRILTGSNSGLPTRPRLLIASRAMSRDITTWTWLATACSSASPRTPSTASRSTGCWKNTSSGCWSTRPASRAYALHHRVEFWVADEAEALDRLAGDVARHHHLDLARLVILLPTLAAFGLAVVFVQVVTPRYTAETKLLLAPAGGRRRPSPSGRILGCRRGRGS
jgi:hypothetical protein